MNDTHATGYTRADFEKMNADNRLRQIHRETLGPGVEAFVAEGRREADHEMDVLHHLMSWAITRDEMVVEGHVIRIPYYAKYPKTDIEFPIPRANRIEVCMDDAKNWYRINRKTGRL